MSLSQSSHNRYLSIPIIQISSQFKTSQTNLTPIIIQIHTNIFQYTEHQQQNTFTINYHMSQNEKPHQPQHQTSNKVEPPSHKYWCYNCQTEISDPLNIQCPQCHSLSIQQITSNNDPRSYEVFTTQSAPVQPVFPQIPTSPNPVTNTQISMGNNGISITINSLLGTVPFNLGQMPLGLQNMFQMLMQNQVGQMGASADQLAALQMCDIQECAICQEGGGQGLKLGCQHAFHKDCIMPWLDRKNNCPTCRVELRRI